MLLLFLIFMFRSQPNMVQSCSAYGCKNRYQKDKNISFHKCFEKRLSVLVCTSEVKLFRISAFVFHRRKFPLARPDVCGKWVSAMKRRNFKPTKYSNICSQHFTRDCFKRQCNNRVLKDNAVPSLFSFSKLQLQASSLEDSFNPDLDFPLSLPLSDAEETPAPEPEPTGPEPTREPHFSACVSCDHNYTVEDTGQQKKRVEQLQEQMEKLRKRLKTVQQKCRRQERQLERFRTMSRVQIQKDPMSRVQIQKDPMSRVQIQKDTAQGSSYVILPTEIYDVLKGIETIGAL